MDSGKHFKPTLPTAQQVLEDLSKESNDLKLEENTAKKISDEKVLSGYNCFKNLNDLKDDLGRLNQLTKELEHWEEVLDQSTNPKAK